MSAAIITTIEQLASPILIRLLPVVESELANAAAHEVPVLVNWLQGQVNNLNARVGVQPQTILPTHPQ